MVWRRNEIILMTTTEGFISIKNHSGGKIDRAQKKDENENELIWNRKIKLVAKFNYLVQLFTNNDKDR